MDKQVKHLMEKLKISEAEAIQVIADDKAIDKGAKLFELSDDQKKMAKQATNAKRGPTVYQFQKRERKQNTGKRAIMEHLEKAVGEIAEEINLLNPEREMEFFIDGKKYKIVLSEPRK